MNEFDHEMETSGAELGSVPKPKLAFIDDEQRILRSMKLLFRKTHDVFITTDPTEYSHLTSKMLYTISTYPLP